MVSVSLIILTRNEEKIVEQNLKMISAYMKQLKNIDDYEILISDKSEDSTPKIVRSLAAEDSGIRYCEVRNKGIGAGIKHGIDQSKYDYLIIYQIDLSYNIDIIEDLFNELLKGYDLVYGSRYQKGAIIRRPLKRRIFSFANRIVIKILFNLKIKDLNGVYGIRKSKIMKFRKLLESDDGFLPTEIAIYGKRNNLKMIEIPVNQYDLRHNSFRWAIRIGSKTLKNALKKRIKLWFERDKSDE